MGCQHWILYNRATGMSTYFSCNSPRCSRAECNECWARKRIAMAQNLISKYHLTRFFTLTISRKYDADISWQSISTWWHTFRQRMRRLAIDYGIRLQFFAILECHKDGYPHIHGFWNIHIDHEDLSRIWSECAPGHVVDVRTVDDSLDAADYLGMNAGRYIGKKQAVDAGRKVRKRKRTMWRSTGMKTDYELHKISLDNECDPDYTKVWILDKHPIPVVLEDSHETEQQGCELERTCSTTSEGGIEESRRVMEAEVRTDERSEGEEVTESESENQCGDTPREREVDYGEETADTNTTGICTGEQHIPYNPIQKPVDPVDDSRERG